MLLRVYLDTSVLGGCFDDEFAGESNDFIKIVLAGGISALVSEVLILEIAEAPEPVQGILGQLLEHGCELLTLTEEAERLADAYIAAGVVVPTFAGDALHVAQATLAAADVVVSWNFRHLVNPVRAKAFNKVNSKFGYGQVIILTPSDVAKSMEENDENNKNI